MEFIKTRLEGVSGHSLEVIRALAFLHSFCHGLSQAALIRIEQFDNKWESSSYAKRLTVSYITGSWKPPSAARTPEISSQKSWETYANSAFKVNVTPAITPTTSTATTSSPVGPFTFKEMIQHEFWKDLYNAFGNKVAAFILTKALLIFEVEENFYMLIASEGCLLQQKLAKASVRPMVRSGGGIPARLNGSFNPYKLQIDENNHNPLKNPTSRKRKLQLDSTEQGEENSHKKAKIVPSSSTCTTIACQSSEIVHSTSNSDGLLIQKVDNLNLTDKNDSGIIRWFRPTPQIVQFLIAEREKMKQQSGLLSGMFGSNSNAKPRPEDTMQQLHFVGIMKNEAFCKIARINVVHKQYRPLDFSKRFPTFPEWQGLVLKEPEEIQSPDRKYNVNVYRISEDFARKNNIRVNIKQRRGRKRNNNNNNAVAEIDGNDATLSSHPPVILPATNDNNSSPPITVSNFIAKHEAVDPFDPLILLDTLPALYNKSSWSHWPKSHVISTSCSKPLYDGSRFLLEDILDNTNVGPPNHHLNNYILNFNPSPEAAPLLKILKKVILFHKKTKDLHKLVKRCITYWMIKNQEKLASKASKVQQRAQWKALQLSNNKKTTPVKIKAIACTKPPNSQSSSDVEIIDLTLVDSPPSDADTTFSPPEQQLLLVQQPLLTTTMIDHHQNQQEQPTILTGSGTTTELHNSSEMKFCSGQKELRGIVYSKLKEQIPHSCILLMLKHILHLSGMEDALGSKKNLRNFYKFLRKSVILAGTRSALQLGQMMASLDPTSCNWMPNITDSIGGCEVYKEFLFAKVVKWIFTNYILTILKVSFYITEVNTSRLHATFYLRESWKSISESVRHRLVTSGTLTHLGPVPPRPTSRRRSVLGINSRIRFLPKKNNDMRPIISLKREARNKWDETNAKVIIDYLVRKNSPHRNRDTNVLRQRWLKFLEEWQRMNRPKLFFVRGDIQDAYPSVHVPKLKLILENVGKELGTMTQREFKVFSKSRVMFRKAVISWNHPTMWTASIGARPCLVQTNEKHNAIMLKPEQVFRKLFPYSNQNVLRIGKHKYDFKRGLPQGWVLSEGYCNIYYGTMDSRHLSKFFKNQGEYFHTSVDDYLYITPNPRLAAKFLEKMELGFPSYNCKFNSSKILTNIYPKVGWPLSLQECEWVTFCGWCFCLTCGHIMRDFRAYVGQDMASSLSFIPRNVTSPENFLIARMKVMLPARLHHFVLDPKINCRSRIVLNIWEAGFIFAFRFYAICRVVYPNLNAMKDPKRAKHVTSAIIVCARAVSRISLSTFRTTYESGENIKCNVSSSEEGFCPCLQSYHGLSRTISANIKKKPKNNSQNRLTPLPRRISEEQLQEPDILYIIFHAFMLKLKQHSSVFGQEILPRLNKMKQFQRSLLCTDSCDFLDKVLGNRMPFPFTNIKV